MHVQKISFTELKGPSSGNGWQNYALPFYIKHDPDLAATAVLDYKQNVMRNSSLQYEIYRGTYLLTI